VSCEARTVDGQTGQKMLPREHFTNRRMARKIASDTDFFYKKKTLRSYSVARPCFLKFL